MTMFVRLALESDEDIVVQMARENIEETRPDMTFDEAQCRDTYKRYLATADPTIFVAVGDQGPVGFMLAGIHGYRAASGLFTTQEVLFVRPAKRGSRAAALLMEHFLSWSIELGAKEALGGNDNGFRSKILARFLKKFGFEQTGFTMRRVLNGHLRK